MSPVDANNSAFEEHLWIKVIDDIGICISVIGLAANCFLFYMIIRCRFLNTKVKVFMGHQVFIDALIAIISIPKMANHGQLSVKVEDNFLGEIICFTWTNKLVFWILICVSVYGIVLHAADRYIAVLHPVFYRSLRHRWYILSILLFYVIASLVNGFLFVNTVTYTNSTCITDIEHQNKQHMVTSTTFIAFLSIWIAAMYFIPILLLIIFHTISIQKFHSKWSAANGSRAPVDTAMENVGSELLKSSLAVSLCYVVSFSIDTVYICMAMLGIIDLKDFTNPINRVGSLLLNVNTVSPFLYCMIVGAFRREILAIVTCKVQQAARSSRVNPLTLYPTAPQGVVSQSQAIPPRT